MASDCQNGELLCDYRRPVVQVYLDALRVLNHSFTHQRGLSIFMELERKLGARLGLTDRDIEATINEF